MYLNEASSHLRTELKSKIDILEPKHLIDVYQLIKSLPQELSKKEKKYAEKLHYYVCKHHLNGKDQNGLINLFKANWDKIYEQKSVTTALIEFFEKDCFYSEVATYARINKDSRAGFIFEDKFALLLSCFLRSKVDLYLGNGNHLNDILLNNSLAVENFKTKQKPDITIIDRKTKTPVFVLELKKSFSSRSVIKEIEKQKAKWNEKGQSKFLFIIFSCSIGKATLYRKQNECKVVCTRLRKNEDEFKKGITPTILDSIEEIFQEIYNSIRR
jgi:hypothetical protein